MSRAIQMPPPPPLLLTKRVTSFLRANLSPHIHSAMLTTPAGSLLAHASNLPASALRRQAAVAASLWALQGPRQPLAPAAPANATAPSESTLTPNKRTKHRPPTVTVQLDSGSVFVIRRLRCGMLFICMGGTETYPQTAGRLTPTPSAPPHHTRLSRSPAPTTPTTEAPSSTAQPTNPFESTKPANATTITAPDANDGELSPRSTLPPAPIPPLQQQSQSKPTTPAPSTPPTLTATLPNSTAEQPLPKSPAPSESAASVLSSHTTGAASTASTTTLAGSSVSVSLMRRQVEELARWLDERLGGLYVPEEGIGIANGTGNGMAGLVGGVRGLEIR
ncbi:hypothetical protein VTI74DRAFT_6841 [Chaetomium olivicolor]